jgi:hypothetical protein
VRCEVRILTSTADAEASDLYGRNIEAWNSRGMPEANASGECNGLILCEFRDKVIKIGVSDI